MEALILWSWLCPGVVQGGTGSVGSIEVSQGKGFVLVPEGRRRKCGCVHSLSVLLVPPDLQQLLLATREGDSKLLNLSNFEGTACGNSLVLYLSLDLTEFQPDFSHINNWHPTSLNVLVQRFVSLHVRTLGHSAAASEERECCYPCSSLLPWAPDRFCGAKQGSPAATPHMQRSR